MSRKITIILTAILGSVVILSVLLGTIIPLSNQTFDERKISFYPSQMLSHPGHTVWLLAEVDLDFTNSDEIYKISIETNCTIEQETKFWLTDENTKLVEIFLHPNQTHLDKTVEVIVTVNNTRNSASKSAYITIVEWEREITTEIENMQKQFVNYLAEMYPSFNINETVSWEGFDNAPMILVVEHYLFRSSFWEMELSRHVMIKPYDWVTVYLRARNSLSPIWSGKIESWGLDNQTIIEIDPPEDIFR
ncbi:MAG: hypothetical protein ACFFDW_09230 [Candidatus Thorarchaeota archaeon]